MCIRGCFPYVVISAILVSMPAHPLDHRVPPPVVALIFAALIWLIARFTPHVAMPAMLRIGVSALLGVAAFTIAFSAFGTFRRAKTTVDPTDPTKASSLVTIGIFRRTRNPMYLGLTLLLTSLAILLSAPAALLGPAVFAMYITRFQIMPEERAMAEKFGEDYARYRSEVRRWV
jgi:protein-S-isoprenylcysteine O-methyltransferase Ste14